jgi:hypothetical protein
LDDRDHLSEVERDGVIKVYNITYSGLINGLEAVKALIASNAQYSLLSRNCTTVAIGIAEAAGVQMPMASGPGELGQLLNGQQCLTPMPGEDVYCATP